MMHNVKIRSSVLDLGSISSLLCWQVSAANFIEIQHCKDSLPIRKSCYPYVRKMVANKCKEVSSTRICVSMVIYMHVYRGYLKLSLLRVGKSHSAEEWNSTYPSL
eukprot:gb/GECG01001659.1/.p1 GENE.gb/GECG01001659.1/~~gb/GECG01001659.1/.p1  ORF type:complete len:105 (+),score=4.77 gb/GECG01001659.1/:1-315(+)